MKNRMKTKAHTNVKVYEDKNYYENPGNRHTHTHT